MKQLKQLKYLKQMVLAALMAQVSVTVLAQAKPDTEKPADGTIIMPADRSSVDGAKRMAPEARTPTAANNRQDRESFLSGRQRFSEELAQCQRLEDTESKQTCINGMHAARGEGLYRD